MNANNALHKNKKITKSLKKVSSFLFFKKQKLSESEKQAEIQNNYDKKLVYSLKKSRFPTFRQFKYLQRYLSKDEKRTLSISMLILLVSISFLGARFYLTHLETSPMRGGEYTEALVGSPQQINPLFASRNDVDSDFSSLIFSSLFKRGVNGELQNDLVEDFFVVGDDSKIYEFKIREDASWHDNTPVTVNDIIFTFNAIQDPAYKSTMRQSFGGVKIEQIDEFNFRFLLTDPYAAFLDLLTFGILPAEIWSQIQPESATLARLNLRPIGSGPYRYESILRDNAGTIKEYKMVANEEYYGKVPYLDLVFKMYPNFEEAINALNNNVVDGISYLPSDKKELLLSPKSFQFHKLLFPQITLIFLNQKTNPALADKSTRQALAYAIDRRAIINDVLNTEAYIVDSPILANSFAYKPDIKKYIYNKEKANELFDSVDWKMTEVTSEMVSLAADQSTVEDEEERQEAEKILAVGEGSWRKKDGNFLQINLTTVERKENHQIINTVKKYWEEAGVKVNIVVLPASIVQGEVIRKRNFEALFYAQVLGSDPDPYAFWHSSQAETGFNIADYKNKEVDRLLEDARLNVETHVRKEKYNKFQELIAEEEPAIFMYSPLYTYVQDNSVRGFNVTNISTPKDRFVNVSEWYTEIGKKLNLNKE